MLLSIALALLPTFQSAPAAPARTPAPPAQAVQVQRGWLGLELGAGGASGVEVVAATGGSPSARAGLRGGDRLVALDGHATRDREGVIALLEERRPGTRVALRIQRKLEVQLDAALKTDDGRFALGVYLAPREAGEGAESLRVGSTNPDSPAERAGVRAQDRVLALDGRALANFDELVAAMKTIEEPRKLELLVEREVVVTLGRVPQSNVLALPRAAQPSVPRRIETPPESREELAQELRRLADELQALRAELAQLRDELQSLRRTRPSRQEPVR